MALEIFHITEVEVANVNCFVLEQNNSDPLQSVFAQGSLLPFFDLSCSCSLPPSTETADTPRHPRSGNVSLQYWNGNVSQKGKP